MTQQRGSIMKFARHACAEVLLVVLGILIAFQIDTWNNGRQLRQKELQYLSSIRDGLLADKQSIDKVTRQNLGKIDVIDALLQLFAGQVSNERAADALVEHAFTIGTFDLYIPNRVAFDNMVSAETIELVTDRTLRLQLASYYSALTPDRGTQERVAEISRRMADLFAADLTHASETPGLFTFDNPGIRKKSEVVLHRDEAFLGNLQLLRAVSVAQNDELEDKVVAIDQLLAGIQLQLGEDG